MNTKEKMQFIRNNHPRLYEMIKKMADAIIRDYGLPSQEEIASYNEALKKYCENYTNELFNMLKLE